MQEDYAGIFFSAKKKVNTKMERCPSWLRGTPGKRVRPQGPAGSSPALSAIKILKFAVLDGEVAVPCNLQPAIAGLNSSPRQVDCRAGLSK